jgi:hypothetical protein
MEDIIFLGKTYCKFCKNFTFEIKNKKYAELDENLNL